MQRVLEVRFASMMRSSIAIHLILSLALLAGVLLLSPSHVRAFVVEGEECGLVVSAAEDYVDVTNLNPGDTKSSYLTAENQGDRDFQYYFNIDKVASTAGEYPGVEGRHLDEVMEFKVEVDDEVLFHGYLEEFAVADMGTLDPGDSERIDITTHLPGEETDNAFQGASVTVRFEFWAECDRSPDSERAHLTVRKFHDESRSGERDEGEEWIEGWPILINGEEYETPLTDMRVRPGTYEISEMERDGWTATTDTTVEVRLSDGDSATVDFGNYREPEEEPETSLTIRKFHDLAGDGEWGEDDPEIMDWTVFVDDDEYETPVTLKLDPGTYEVSEQLDDEEWIPTTDHSLVVHLEEGESETVVFGNARVEEETIPPPAPEAPATGEIPPGIFYSIGGLFVLAGLLLTMRLRAR